MWGGRKGSGIIHKLLSIATHSLLFFTNSPNAPLDKTSGSNICRWGLNCGTVHVHGGKPQNFHLKLIHSHTFTYQAFLQFIHTMGRSPEQFIM